VIFLPRKQKYNLSDEDAKALDEGSANIKELATKYNTNPQTMYNIKRSRKLKTSMELVDPDPQIKSTDLSKSSGLGGDIAPKSAESILPEKKTVDYDTLVSGLWSALDGMCILISTMSRGKMEYKKLTTNEITLLTNSTKNNSWIQKLSSMGQVSNIVMFGTIAMVFKDRFKFKKEDKHNNKDPNCKCKKCESDRNKESEQLETEKELSFEEMAKKEQESYDQDEETKDLNEAVQSINDVITPTIKEIDTGMIPTQNNLNDVVPEVKVLEQNRQESEGDKNIKEGKSFKW